MAVLIKPCAMSPFARNIHHMTMAVQGDKPKRMTPAMYWGFPAKKVLAKSVINGGAITQLAITVTSRGLGFNAAFLMSLNRMLTTVGYIMKKSSIPIGIDSFTNLSESMNSPNSGMNLPTSKPTTMQMAIQSVRYFSHSPSDSSFFTCSSLVSDTILATRHPLERFRGKDVNKFRGYAVNDSVYAVVYG